MTLSRRRAIGLIGAGLPLATAASRLEAEALPAPAAQQPRVYDQPGLEWVMDILPFCTAPESMGGKGGKNGDDQTAADGIREELWPIVGGTFYGRGIKGTVVPGGGDFPVVRPDGVEIIDALYRLRTDDGVQIIIHNMGPRYSENRFRLQPSFNVPGKKYAWLRESVFVATLIYPIPPEIPAPDFGPNANGRLIQVFRIT
ncbi:DUF3237 domain-containing protein [Novosphingobium sp. PASSN1]|uniref:DUF3237 domain-containing protein n=1 Tax=Novosphingobium sp. PASSN1 TaxID=2015561 RepID=UPI000BDAC85B|nr:DUF3237 domain-containing protein [Novosphingobium sp. PASSN1]OYU35113.1 MAG: hypothetical protein CFE35_11825 [Novosphingobium sp. PASSN1]